MRYYEQKYTEFTTLTREKVFVVERPSDAEDLLHSFGVINFSASRFVDVENPDSAIVGPAHDRLACGAAKGPD